MNDGYGTTMLINLNLEELTLINDNNGLDNTKLYYFPKLKYLKVLPGNNKITNGSIHIGLGHLFANKKLKHPEILELDKNHNYPINKRELENYKKGLIDFKNYCKENNIKLKWI